MKQINIEKLDSLQLDRETIERFSILITSTVVSNAMISSEESSFILMNEENIDCERTVVVYDTVKNQQVCTFVSDEDDFDVICEIKKNIVIYLMQEYTKEGYVAGLVDSYIFQVDGAYHTEPDTIVFISNKIDSSNITRISYMADGKIFANISEDEAIEISRDDFIDIGIIEL